MTIKELTEHRAKTVDEADAIFAKADEESRPLTDEERTKVDELTGAAKAYTADIAQRDALEIERGNLHEDQPDFRAMSTDDLGEIDQRGAAKRDPEPFSFGEYLVAVRNATKSQGRIFDPRLARGHMPSSETRQTGSSEGVAADGGFFVQVDHHTDILADVHKGADVLSRCRKITVGPNANGITMNGINETDRTDGNRYGGVLGYWLAEAGTKTASEPKFKRIELNLKKVAALWYATDELLQDTTAVSQIAAQAFTEELSFLTEAAIINGTGAGQPLGIMNSPSRVRVPKQPAQAAATIVAENIFDMYSRMLPKSLGNAVWYVNQDTWPQLFNLHLAVGAGGAPMFIPEAGITDTPAGKLMGRPIVPIEYCQTLGTEGDIIFADMNHYIVIDKGGASSGIQSDSSIHVKFVYDETVFRWVYRVDGQPDRALPTTPYLGANTLSPFVTLRVRA